MKLRDTRNVIVVIPVIPELFKMLMSRSHKPHTYDPSVTVGCQFGSSQEAEIFIPFFSFRSFSEKRWCLILQILYDIFFKNFLYFFFLFCFSSVSENESLGRITFKGVLIFFLLFLMHLRSHFLSLYLREKFKYWHPGIKESNNVFYFPVGTIFFYSFRHSYISENKSFGRISFKDVLAYLFYFPLMHLQILCLFLLERNIKVFTIGC